MHFLKAIFIVLEVLFLFNLLIFVHELGHFLAARWRGLKIERFAIWFGKPIWKKNIGGVEYAMGSIPAGGYVSLPQMAPMEMIEGKSDNASEQLPPISPLDKIIVAVAGPLFSFGLAFVFAVIVWGVGKPELKSNADTTIGWVDPTGPAWKAGLRPGDKILEVDNHPVTEFAPPSQDSITWRIVTSEGEDIPIKYQRNDTVAVVHAIPIKLPTKWYERKSLRKILVAPSQPTIIGEIASNSPAALAGLKEKDQIIKLNGEKIYSPDAVIEAEKEMTNGPLHSAALTIQRGTNVFDATLTPEKPVQPSDATPSFGITAFTIKSDEIITHPSPFSQIRDSAGQMIATFKTLLSPKSDVGVQQLGSAVMIIRVYKTFFDADNGWQRAIWFSVVFNVNLALLNMLPFPVLDGGHITLALVEIIRRRPVSAKFLNFLQSACALVLIAFMLFLAFFDTGDWVRSARQDREQPVVFAPHSK
jgi:regulator of sigma E protease